MNSTTLEVQITHTHVCPYITEQGKNKQINKKVKFVHIRRINIKSKAKFVLS